MSTPLRPHYRLALYALAGGLWNSAAQDPAAAQSPVSAVVQVNREVEIGATTLYRGYKESFPAGVAGGDSENGWTLGVEAQARWTGDVGPAHHLFAALQVAYNGGNLDYRGSVFGTNTPLTFRSGLTNTLVRAEAGKGFAVTPRLLVTPVAQMGYQVWNRNFGSGQTEDYRTLTAGVGLRADYAVTQRLVVSGNMGVAGMIDPQITFNYANSYAAALAARPLYQGGLGADYALTGHFHLSADAWVSRYGYGRSVDVVTTERGRIFEPASSTTDSLLQLAVAYAF